MKRFTSILLLGIVLAFQSFSGVCAEQRGVISLKDGKEITFDAMMQEAGGTAVIFVGEVHNDVAHHQLQLQIVKTLVERKEKVAIGLEMFMADSQQALDDWSAGKMGEEEFKAIFGRNWTFDWALYRDLLLYARDNRIPLVALNIPREIASKVARQGFAALSDEERKSLPQGVTCELKSSYTELLQKAFGQVFKHLVKQSNFTNFCEAQSLRNSAFAWHLSRYMQQHPDRHVVAITGIWHAVKGGAPDRLSLGDKKNFRVILPEIKELASGTATIKEGDYLVRK